MQPAVIGQHEEHRDLQQGQPSPRAAGATVCGWTLERPLGGGPACESWVGKRNDETALVRILRPGLAADPKAQSEWVRASWAANRFNHARVMKVLEQGQMPAPDGAAVIVRAWAEGESLEDVVAKGLLDAAGALRLTEQVLDALEMAHAHGILHGALHPRNVIVTPRGSARVVDFATTPGLLARRSGTSQPLASTRRGPFLAPERRTIPVAPCTELADVWGAGACLHFALTGKAPGTDGAQLEGVDPDVAAIVRLALSADPACRYESAYAMLGDVRRVLAGHKPHLDGRAAPVPSQRILGLAPTSSVARAPSLAPPPSQTSPAAGPRHRLGNALLLLAIALLAGLATFVLVRERLADEGRQDGRQAPPASVEAP